MKRKLPTVLILLSMALLGAMYWIDLSYYTSPSSGLARRGTEWIRYAVLLVPLLMALLGLRTVGPRGIAVLRMENPVLAVLFGLAGVSGGVYGAARAIVSIMGGSVYGILLGGVFLWYGIWMVLCGIQLYSQSSTAPTGGAALGVLAALPFCLLTVHRVLVNPSSLYRTGPIFYAFSALFAMLWFGMLLRALYVSMPQRRVKRMYFVGVFTFLFNTCLGLLGGVHNFLFYGDSWVDLFEAIAMAFLGLVAGSVSVAVAGQGEEAPAASKAAT